MMTKKALARRLYGATVIVLVTLHFGSLWPVVTLFATSAIAACVMVFLAVAVSFSRLSLADLRAADAGTLVELLRDANRAIWNLPAMAASEVFRLWLVWILAASAYAQELCLVAAILSVTQLAWLAVAGLPPCPAEKT